MRKLSFLFIISFLLALFTGCGGEPPTPRPSGGGSESPGLVSPTVTPLPEERQEKPEDGESILYIGASRTAIMISRKLFHGWSRPYGLSM